MKPAPGKIRWGTDLVSAISSVVLGTVLSVLLVAVSGLIPWCTAEYVPTYTDPTNILEATFGIFFNLTSGLLFGSACIVVAAAVGFAIFLVLLAVINLLIVFLRVKEYRLLNFVVSIVLSNIFLSLLLVILRLIVGYFQSG
jgi:hypothetical protein